MPCFVILLVIIGLFCGIVGQAAFKKAFPNNVNSALFGGVCFLLGILLTVGVLVVGFNIFALRL